MSGHLGQIAPFHVAIIMDGNGRWATSRGLSRIAGHVRGARRVNEIVRACPHLGVTHLTLFAFSTENWRRPLAEVEGLMGIFRQYIVANMASLRRRGVRVRFLGMRHRLPPALREMMTVLETHTRDCEGLNLTIAIDYGGRDELTRAARSLARQVEDGSLDPSGLAEAGLADALDTRGLPDPDLVIRTSGEQRISNFLLWQGVYAEYAFVAEAWPEFGVRQFRGAIDTGRARCRRFGALTSTRGSQPGSRRSRDLTSG